MSAADFMHLPMAARIFIALMFAPAVWATVLAIVAVVKDVGRYFTTSGKREATTGVEDTRVPS